MHQIGIKDSQKRKIYRENPVSESLFKACNFIKKETPTQVSVCEFCEIC